MIGAALLVVGLLLILTAFVSPRSGEATPASPDRTFSPGTGAGGSPGPAGRLGPDGRPATASGTEGAAAAAAAAPTPRLGQLFAPGWSRHPLRAVLFSPFDAATWEANFAIGVGFWVGIFSFAGLVAILSAGFTLLFAGVGIVVLAVGIELARLVAREERWRARLADPRPLLAHPYRPYGRSLRDIAFAQFGDESRWRDVVYVALNFALSVLEFAVVLSVWALALALLTMPLWYDVEPGAALPAFLGSFGSHAPAASLARALIGAALVPVAASLSQGVMALHRALVSGLLCVSESGELRRRVATLTESRSAVLDVEASELRRIERDLHDGAQQRLVMLTIDLGLAAERVDSDPARARQLIDDARDQARLALAELRDLVRGIAPAILLDRGLVAALSAIAGRNSVPTVVDSRMPPEVRLPPAIERAAYFVVAEALANVAKHSHATRCEVRCGEAYGRFLVEVVDDGQGGAEICPGGGLAGLVGRVEALDGRLTVQSPAGGPTILRADFPLPYRPYVWQPAPGPWQPRPAQAQWQAGGASAPAAGGAPIVAAPARPPAAAPAPAPRPVSPPPASPAPAAGAPAAGGQLPPIGPSVPSTASPPPAFDPERPAGE